jgi:hypothetical protein
MKAARKTGADFTATGLAARTPKSTRLTLRRPARWATTGAVLFVILLATGRGVATQPLTQPAWATRAAKLLTDLPVKPSASMTGYSRDKFGEPWNRADRRFYAASRAPASLTAARSQTGSPNLSRYITQACSRGGEAHPRVPRVAMSDT